MSIASLWEITIKVKLGKLEIKGTVESIADDITENNFNVLAINFAHIVENYTLDFHHRDPFDRIIIAQAKVERMHVIGKDQIFDQYLSEDIKRFW